MSILGKFVNTFCSWFRLYFEEDGGIPFTMQQIESLIRMSQTHARWRRHAQFNDDLAISTLLKKSFIAVERSKPIICFIWCNSLVKKCASHVFSNGVGHSFELQWKVFRCIVGRSTYSSSPEELELQCNLPKVNFRRNRSLDRGLARFDNDAM